MNTKQKPVEILVTPEQYIEALKGCRKRVYKIYYPIDDSIYNMERRLETGYSSLEDQSKKALKNAVEFSENITKELKRLYNSEIKY